MKMRDFRLNGGFPKRKRVIFAKMGDLRKRVIFWLNGGFAKRKRVIFGLNGGFAKRKRVICGLNGGFSKRKRVIFSEMGDL